MSLKHRITAGLLTACFAIGATGCQPTTSPSDTTDETSTTAPTTLGTADDSAVLSFFDERDLNDAPDLTSATVITLADNGTTVQGEGVSVNGNTVTVNREGTYRLTGALSDGQLRVEAAGALVHLVFDGVSIHSSQTAPLFVRKADKVIVTLADGSQNALSDSAEAVYEDAENEEPGGTLFSKADLTVNGSGSLAVNAAFRDGIVSRDGLKIVDGRITVRAVDDALMGRDYVLVRDGELTLTADGDGIKSTNDGGEEVGFVQVQGGTVTIDAQKDGIQATSALNITNGNIRITAGGGSANGAANTQFDYGWGAQSADTQSVGKGLKAGTVLTVSGGTVEVDAADDALHSNDTVCIVGGDIEAAAGDDGVHADAALTISDGRLTLTQSYEGLEGATITLEGGDISVVASDDGVNASNGTTGDYRDPMAADGSKLIITGGHIYINAQGDGLDSNGTVEMSGGDVQVLGPSNGGNGTFDFASAMDITGGTLVAIGSMGMAQTPTSNTQQSIVWNGCSLSSLSDLTLTHASGEVLVEMEATRAAQWAYITSPLLKEGEIYTVSCGATEETLTLQAGENTLGQAMGGQMGGGQMGGGHMGGGPMGDMEPPGGFY